MIKFLTMFEHYETMGKLLPEKNRLNPIGQWLRSTSFDELPKLWNTAKGEMSLLEPRPFLVKYRDYYHDA